MRYGEVHSTLWQEVRFVKVSPLAQRLYLYFLSAPASNCIGFYQIPPGYACTDLKCQDQEFREWLGELVQVDLVRWDPGHNVVLIVDYLAEFPICNQSHFSAALKQLKGLPDTSLTTELAEIIKAIPDERLSSPKGQKREWTLALLKALPGQGCPQGCPQGCEHRSVPDPDPVPVPVTEENSLLEKESSSSVIEQEKKTAPVQSRDLKARMAMAWNSSFGKDPNPAQMRILLDYVSKLDPEIVTAGILATGGRDPRSPIAYLKKVLDQKLETREATASEAQPDNFKADRRADEEAAELAAAAWKQVESLPTDEQEKLREGAIRALESDFKPEFILAPLIQAKMVELFQDPPESDPASGGVEDPW